MGDDLQQIYSMRGSCKGRSASICAPGSSSLEALIQQQHGGGQSSGPTSGTGTPTKHQETPEPGRRRGKPAVRSQSARIASGRSIRRKQQQHQQQLNNNPEGKRDGHYNSEPRLTESPEPSPGIRRKGSRRGVSVYQHRKSAAFLDVPDGRHNRGADDGDPEDEDSYRLRSFSSTSKGIVNRGDSFRRRRSRSSSLCPGHHGLPADRDTPPRSPGGIRTIVAEEDANCLQSLPPTGNGAEHHLPSLGIAEANLHHDTRCYKVALIGAAGVGKTALISQFMTSECINAYDRQKDISGEQTVSIMLNGEESELHFLNIQNPKDIDKIEPPDAFVVLYSVVDRNSMTKAETELRSLHDAGLLRGRSVLVAANKIDLARSRAVTAQDGKCLACTYRAKFIEISVGINHNVDELLVGILSQIRLKEAQLPTGGLEAVPGSPQWYKSRGVVRASMKARQMFTWIFGKEDSKFKNCENLHIL